MCRREGGREGIASTIGCWGWLSFVFECHWYSRHPVVWCLLSTRSSSMPCGEVRLRHLWRITEFLEHASYLNARMLMGLLVLTAATVIWKLALFICRFYLYTIRSSPQPCEHIPVIVGDCMHIVRCCRCCMFVLICVAVCWCSCCFCSSCDIVLASLFYVCFYFEYCALLSFALHASVL